MIIDSLILAESKKIERKFPSNYDEFDRPFFLDGFRYNTNLVRLNSYSNVIATDFALYEGNRVIKECLATKTHQFRMQFRHLLSKRLFHKRVKLSNDKTYLFANDYWTDSHYHWHCDLLPRLWLLRDNLKDYSLLLPPGPYVKSNALKSLALAEMKPAEVIFMKADCYYDVPNLHMPTHVSVSGMTDPAIMTDLRRRIAGSLNLSVEKAKRLYISRSNARYRKVLNEEDVVPLMKNFGYQVLKFEEYSLEEQISICANAESLAGIHGAGHTNTLFMKPGTSLLEFRRNGVHHNHCYWDLASGGDQNYYYCFGEPDSDMAIEGNGCNLKMNIATLEKTLMKMHAD